MKILNLILALAVVGFRAQAQDGVSVFSAEVYEVGIYSAQVVNKTFEPSVASGTNEWLESFTLVQATTNVPALIGTRFGFRFTIHGTPTNAPIVLKMVGQHPPYKNPKTGITHSREEYELESWIGHTYTSYLFEEKWELIPGNFLFEVWHMGQKLCEQSFAIVNAAKSEDAFPTTPKTKITHVQIEKIILPLCFGGFSFFMLYRGIKLGRIWVKRVGSIDRKTSPWNFRVGFVLYTLFFLTSLAALISELVKLLR